jgi:RimJ/RimL family protein N-acetyltransferase
MTAARRVGPTWPVETERLRLRPFAEADLDWLHRVYGDEDVVRWLVHEPRSLRRVRDLLTKKIAGATVATDGDWLAAAVEVRETGQLVGDCALQLVSREHRLGEIGFVFDPAHQGRGYATEAARAFLGVAFDDLGLHRVIGRVEPRNGPSARVLEKLGMRREAHFVENELIKGEWQSELVYALLEREWRDGPGP